MADGSFNRSASGAMARGVALIVAAVIVGVVLLRSTDGTEAFRADTSADEQTDGTQPATGTNTNSTQTTAKPATGGNTTTTAAAAHDPAKVTVLVANGSGVAGAAGKIATTLKGSNFIAQAANTLAPVSTSVVYFTAGYEADAKAIAALLKPSPGVAAIPNPLPVADLAGAHVLVVVAADLANA